MITKKQLSPEIKKFVEYKLEHFPETQKELREYKKAMIPSGVAAYSTDITHASGENRSTENIAVKMVTDAYVMEAEKTIRAFDRVLSSLDNTDTRLITLCYYRKSHTKEGAATACHVSKTAAYDRINTVLYRLALEMGYIQL